MKAFCMSTAGQLSMGMLLVIDVFVAFARRRAGAPILTSA
jgi:hypothetical protein